VLSAALVAETAERLSDAITRHAPAAFASSFGAEDMVVLDLVARLAPPLRDGIEVFTLDTGRLPVETLALIDTARDRYGLPLRVYRPDPVAVDAYVAAHGRDAFYDSVDLRKRCCAIRKTEPLSRALEGKALWITGLRREQTVTRAAVDVLAFDATNGLMKLNPLADWPNDDVWAYVREHDVPVNALHARDYPSIGCEPCTRAVRPGEDLRAGRWWWEQADSRECGLHVAHGGRLVPRREPMIPVTARSSR
jgi:phosphoadenosine phosphosulfate reductase